MPNVSHLEDAEPSTEVLVRVTEVAREVEGGKLMAIQNHAEAAAGTASGMQGTHIENLWASDEIAH